MDDGSLNGVNCRLSTDGFSEGDNNRLRDMLEDKFGIIGSVYNYIRNGSFYYYLFFNKENSKKMAGMIGEYVVDCMRYKLEGRW
jgi:hypothetical protein